MSDLIGSARDYPADLLRLFVCRCPGKGKKVWEAHLLLSSRTFLPEKELAMSRLFFVFSYTTLKLVPGIVTRISPSKTSTIIFDPV